MIAESKSRPENGTFFQDEQEGVKFVTSPGVNFFTFAR